MQHHVFISYARTDNQPRGRDGRGWVHIFNEELKAWHKRTTGRELRTFFDVCDIANGEDWETRIQSELRRSRIFIAILSPNYLASPWCRLELEDYVRHEQSVAPGGQGVRPIYFASVPELEGDKQAAEELEWVVQELQRRNRDAGLNWCDWREAGVDALLQLDVEDRLADLAENPQPPLDVFAGGIGTLSTKIGERLNDAALAELAGGLGNLQASHVHFVGRGAEMAEIHRNLIENRAQIVTALHGLGGQGKSALARQYAHAFASYYAAGGRWEVDCETLGQGLDEEARKDRLTLLALAFDRLLDRIRLRAARDDLAEDRRFATLVLTEEEQKKPAADRLGVMLTRLRAFTVDGWQERLEALRGQVAEPHGGWPANHDPRMLVILDNVADQSLLNADAFGALQRPDWLELIVTTRLAPEELGDGAGMKTLKIDHLPPGDAVELIRGFLRKAGNRPPLDETEKQAVRGIADLLGGFTLAVELAGAFLSVNPRVPVAGYLQRLREEGLQTVDAAVSEGRTAGTVEALIRHRERQVAVIVEQTLDGLDAVEVDVLHLASHFGPDHVVLDWLHQAAAKRHPSLAETPVGRESPWDAVVARLTGRRLLTESDSPGILRLHRMVREHLRQMVGSERLGGDRELMLEQAYEIALAMDDYHTGWFARPEAWLPLQGALEALVEQLLNDQRPDLPAIVALGLLIDMELTVGVLSKAEPLLHRQRSLTTAATKANPDSAIARRELFLSQIRISDFYLKRRAPGDAELVLAAYEVALETLMQRFDQESERANTLRDLSLVQVKIGDFCQQRGAPDDTERALESYQNSLETRRHLLEHYPNCAQTKRDLSVSLSKIGGFYMERGAPGDTERALEANQESLEMRRFLLEQDSESAQAKRDLSVSQLKIGHCLLRRGAPNDVQRALEAYELAHKTFKQLVDDNPNSAQTKRDLSVAQIDIGDLFLRHSSSDDAERALKAYQASLETRRQLVEDNPDSVQARRDLSISQKKIGVFYMQRGAPGDAERALEAFQAALEIDRQLVEDNPDSAEAKRDLSVSQKKIGDFYLRRGARGDTERALKVYRESLETRRQLVKDSPKSAVAKRDLVIILSKFVPASLLAGQGDQLFPMLQEAKDLLERMEAEGFDLSRQERELLDSLRADLPSPPSSPVPASGGRPVPQGSADDQA